jgi:hypothetical protein
MLGSLLALIAVKGAAAQEEKTDKLMNGRAWSELKPAIKIAWLTGVYEAVFVWGIDLQLLQRDNLPKGFKDVNAIFLNFPNSLTFGEIGESLDAFYTEPTNRRIPVLYALNWVKLKADGVPVQALKDWEAGMRGEFAAAPATP